MNRWIETWNRAAALWWDWTVTSTWQGLLLLVAVAGLFAVARRMPNGLRYGLLLVVLLKLAMPPIIGLSYGFSDLLADSLKKESAPPPAMETLVSGRVQPLPSKAVAPVLPAIDDPPRKVTLSSWGWLLLLEVVGMFGVLALVGRRMAEDRAVLRECSEGDAALRSRFQHAVETIGVWRRPCLCVSARAVSPRSGGIFRPYVLLPDWVASLSGEAQESVLAHELVHARRLDALWNALQALVQALHWWNPAVWWLNRHIRETRELCCDDRVLSCGIVSRASYSRALVEVAARVSRPGFSFAASGMADGYTSIDKRVRSALAGRPPQRRWGRLWGVVLLVLVAAWTLPGASDDVPQPEMSETITEDGQLDIRNMNFGQAERTAAGDTRYSEVSFLFIPGAESAIEIQVKAGSLLHSHESSPELLAENARLSLRCGSGTGKALVVSGNFLRLSYSRGAAGGVRIEGDMTAELEGVTIQAEELQLQVGCSIGFREAVITSSDFDTLRTSLLFVDLETGAFEMQQGHVDAIDVAKQGNTLRYRMAINAGSMAGNQRSSRVEALEDASIDLIERDDEQARIRLESEHLDFEYPETADGTTVVDILGEIDATHELFSLGARRVRVGEGLEFSDVVVRTRDFGEIRSPLVRADLAARRLDILEPDMDEAKLKAAFGTDASARTADGWLTLPFQVARQFDIDVWVVEVDAEAELGLPEGSVLQPDETDMVALEINDGMGYLRPMPPIVVGRVGEASLLACQARIQDLEEEGRAKVISAPKVITPEGQKARISIGSEIPYNRDGEDAFKFVGTKVFILPTLVETEGRGEALQLLLTYLHCWKTQPESSVPSAHSFESTAFVHTLTIAPSSAASNCYFLLPGREGRSDLVTIRATIVQPA